MCQDSKNESKPLKCERATKLKNRSKPFKNDFSPRRETLSCVTLPKTSQNRRGLLRRAVPAATTAAGGVLTFSVVWHHRVTIDRDTIFRFVDSYLSAAAILCGRFLYVCEILRGKANQARNAKLRESCEIAAFLCCFPGSFVDFKVSLRSVWILRGDKKRPHSMAAADK